MEYKDPGRYIPIIYLLYSWGSQFGVPSRVPLNLSAQIQKKRTLPRCRECPNKLYVCIHTAIHVHSFGAIPFCYGLVPNFLSWC